MGVPSVSLVLEQTLGHRTHAINLERALRQDDPGRFAVHHVEYGDASRIPWALRASAQAYRAVRGEGAGVTFFHTQTTALFAPMAVGRRDFVVSVDATPVQVDAMGFWYRHEAGPSWAESRKRDWYRWVFSRASAIVSWSEWAAESVRRDYGVSRTPIEVVHPGAPASFFDVERNSERRPRPTFLFVGGDLERKGGQLLVRAFEAVRDRADLVMVTDSPAADALPSWVRVLRDVRAGTPEHLRVFAEADVFCLPTLADCTPLVIGEAMAAGLPVLTTTVGSNAESVPAGAGLLVPPGDPHALETALRELVESPSRLREMGCAAREHAALHMHADRNAARVLTLLQEYARQAA
ncbi:MAG: glycosyltransferase family 4 protein [Dehalococcoidia bacterium]|nr:glycosyltransferase family 4 protein [Dehalococcoidia bacterium]